MGVNVKRRSQKQEKSVAKSFSAKTVVASGAKWNAKGDVRNDKFLIECKTTSKDYYSVTTKIWEKICREADRDGMRIPLLIVDLKDSKRFVVFNLDYFDRDFNEFEYNSMVEIKSSYRIKDNWEHIDSMPFFFQLKASDNYLRKYHDLFVWTYDKFTDYFKGEL